MTTINGPIEILKLLDRSNCGKCGKPTCLAFAGAVFKGQQTLDQCPKLDSETIKRCTAITPERKSAEQMGEEAIQYLKSRIATIDLSAAAERLGAKYADGRLTITCLGKDFSIDSQGRIITDIHVNPWITGPVLDYILNGAGIPVSGEWVTFRELDGGENRYPLFEQRCEKPLKRVADTYTGLFADMLQIFNGKQVEHHYPADITIVLHPLPRVPIMICYTKPEDGLESSLVILFDTTAPRNLSMESIFTLATGLTMMFEKIALRHGRT